MRHQPDLACIHARRPLNQMPLACEHADCHAHLAVARLSRPEVEGAQLAGAAITRGIRRAASRPCLPSRSMQVHKRPASFTRADGGERLCCSKRAERAVRKAARGARAPRVVACACLSPLAIRGLVRVKADTHVCVCLKLLGPSPGPQGVGLPTRDTGAAQVAPRRRVWG